MRERRATFALFFIGIFMFFSSFSMHQAFGQDPNQGVDPHDFFDASNEPADEAFFHLEKYFEVGMMGGLGLFTGGLGSSHGLGGAFGFNMIYYFDMMFALDMGIWFSFQENAVVGIDESISSSTLAEESVTWLIVPNTAVRFYFPTNQLSRFLASLNPYLVGGFDWVLRKRSISTSQAGGTDTGRAGQSFSEGNVGFCFGTGIAALVYGETLYLGLDVRFHYMILKGEQDDTSGFSRDGDYVTIFGTFTHSF